MTTENPSDLTGKFLIAMPGIGDPRFENALVYLCAHSEDGTMGLIVNRQSDDVVIDDVLDQLEIKACDDMPALAVHFGGPVEMGRGFVLHEAAYQDGDATMVVDENFAMTASQDILKDIARGQGPERRIFCLGYAGWGPQQLEDEISANGWLTCDASKDIVFKLPDARKWEATLKTLGVSPEFLSGAAGHA